MQLNDMLMYKVTEGDDCIVITHRNVVPKVEGAEPLIIAPAATIAEYLARYFHARQQGKPLKAAHVEALEGTKIIARGHLDNPLGQKKQA